MTLLDRGLRQRLDRLSYDRLWDLACALEVAPERLPYVYETSDRDKIAKRIRTAIRADLRAEGKSVAMASTDS